jgi:hypothetical protein
MISLWSCFEGVAWRELLGGNCLEGIAWRELLGGSCLEGACLTEVGMYQFGAEHLKLGYCCSILTSFILHHFTPNLGYCCSVFAGFIL